MRKERKWHILLHLLADDKMPAITCPVPYVHKLTLNESTVINLFDHPATAASLTVTYEPATLLVSASDVGREFVVMATATDIFGRNASCQFMVVVEGK